MLLNRLESKSSTPRIEIRLLRRLKIHKEVSLEASSKTNSKDHKTNTIPNLVSTAQKILVQDLARISLKDKKISHRPKVYNRTKLSRPSTTTANKFTEEVHNHLTERQCQHKNKCELEILQWEM